MDERRWMGVTGQVEWFRRLNGDKMALMSGLPKAYGKVA